MDAYAVLCPAAGVSTGKELRSKGLNRIGNMLVPNSNYCLFEDWIMPLLDQMLKEQQEQGTVWTPSKVST
jgi:deoxyhypusine synthase